ncbi:ABC transporter ATP-binding protein [Anaerosalibacter massiliensis]|uniref:ABC transporter ATP-binding protein n=1 Tax=Anaerosalibacter massiliensis TaxID=1347392 RepID=A0A9X2S4Z5_9FIRM|nr:ABC transporter ATP-binding protein [Anaerosalibacter massiliensis]MCR2044130.1 ABC transporter ATP-binding protein [Anaerosalibacter massiliensis]
MPLPTISYHKKEGASLITLKNIEKNFNNIKVLKNISINIEKGEFVSLIGPSGCGKSTIFNIISGLIPQDSGEIYVNGTIGYMQQKDLLLPWKTIMDNVALPLTIKGVDKKTRENKVKKYLPIVGLEGYEKNYPSQLSGGMRQRASFLRTLMASEDIMLLDEAFASLDSITKSKMQMWLLDMKNRLNNTILLITHDIDEALLLSDRIYVLSSKPATIKKEIILDFNTANKRERILSSKTLKLKEEILKVL